MTGTLKKSAVKVIIILALFLTISLTELSPRQAHAQPGPYSVNMIVNPSFEGNPPPSSQCTAFPCWVTDTYNDGNVGSTITRNSTFSVNGNYSERLDLSSTPIANNPAIVGPMNEGHITLYQQLYQQVASTYFDNFTDRPDGLNLWIYLQPKFAGFSLFDIRIKASDSTEMDYFYTNPDAFSVANGIFQNSTNGGEQGKPVKEIVLPTLPLNKWIHFARNLRQDWQAPMTNLPAGQTDSGFGLNVTIDRLMLEATFYRSPSLVTYGTTAWIDDVNLYVNSNTPPPPQPPSNYWTAFDFTDASGAPVNNMVKWRMFNSTGSLVSGYTQRDSTLRLEPYYVEVYFPTTTGQSPEPYRILEYKIVYLNTTTTIRLQMYQDPQTATPWGYMALNNTATVNFAKENASLMQFNLQGTQGIPYTIIVAVTQKPILIQRNNDDPSLVQWTYDSTARVARITTVITGNFSIFLTPPIKVPVIGFTDLLSNPVSNNLSWKLFNSQDIQVSTIPGQYLQNDYYTLQVYYYGYMIYKGNLDPAASSLKLQMFPISSPETGYIAFNSTVSSVSILENTATAFSFKAEGTGPSTIAVNVLANPTRIEKDGAAISGWTYNLTSGTVAIQTAQLGTFTIVYSNTTPIIPLLYVGAVVGAVAIATAGLLVWRRTKSRTPTQSRPVEKKSETREERKAKQKIPQKSQR